MMLITPTFKKYSLDLIVSGTLIPKYVSMNAVWNAVNNFKALLQLPTLLRAGT